jgi:glycerophosphoryl diester phosphodiesterase
MHHLDGLNVWAGNMLDESMIRQVHDAGLLLYCWTVNSLEKARKLSDWGIDGITTDRVGRINGQL